VKPHSFSTYLLSQQPLARHVWRYPPHADMQAGEPASLRMQNFRHTLSRSLQVFASAGKTNASASMPIAHAPMSRSNNFPL